MRVQKAQVLCYCVCFLEAAENKALFTDGSLDDVIVGAAAVSRPLARPCFFDGCRAFFCVDNVKLQSRPTVCSCDSIEPMYKKPIYTENHHRDAHMCCVLKKASLFFHASHKGHLDYVPSQGHNCPFFKNTQQPLASFPFFTAIKVVKKPHIQVFIVGYKEAFFARLLSCCRLLLGRLAFLQSPLDAFMTFSCMTSISAGTWVKAANMRV